MIGGGAGSPLTVSAATEGGTAVISVAGELDFTNAPLLLEQLGTSLDRGHTRLVFDLAGMSFCDTIGLSVFVRAKNRCDPVNGVVRLAGLQPGVVRVFEITGLAEVIPTFPTVADAVGAVAPPSAHAR
jgi:anti-sigma B factor antagonist